MHELIPTDKETNVAAPIDIRSRIFTIRGVQVMLAPDLADLYRVETRIFNQAVKRNIDRFPENFRFQLTKNELEEVITNCDNPDRLRFSPQAPYAFTEQGIGMLSGVLNSEVAVQISIRIMNTFVAMRRTLATLAPVMVRLDNLERKQLKQQESIEANPTFHVRVKNPGGCRGFGRRSSLHFGFRRFDEVA